MDCICHTQCQTRLDSGKIKFFEVGEVGTFKKCPVHFNPIEEHEVDFSTAGEEELLAAEWTFKDLSAFSEKEYGVKLKGNAKSDKELIISRFMDARYRSVI